MVTSQRRRQGFYARCLRRILGIPSAYVSRVSNARVFAQAGRRPLTEQILKRQLLLLRRVWDSPPGDPLRRDVFVGNSIDPVVGHFVRRVGRPRLDWTNEVMKESSKRMGAQKFRRMLLDQSDGSYIRWRDYVERLFE